MKSIVTYRVQSPNWLSDEHFERNFEQLFRYRDKIDEIALFTGYTHSPLTIETTEAMAQIGKERMALLKGMGFKVGYNYQVILGHNKENKEYSLKGDYELSMNPDGNIVTGCLCPRGKNVQKYVRECFRLIAESEPDFIWIDDDVRMMWHGHGFPDYDCFCPNCMAEFGKEIGIDNFTREKFNEITAGENPDKMKYRKAWMKFCRDSIGQIMKIGREECDKVNKDMILGYMHPDAVCCDSDFDYFAKIMAGENNLPVKFRPGGGYYDDRDKDGLVKKVLYLGRQISNIPKEHMDIQSELENFPYDQLIKSAYANVLESILFIGAGCTGVTYNCHHQESWGSEYSTVEENEVRFSKVLPYREFFDECVETFGREPNRGFYFDLDTMSYLSQNYEEGKWLYEEPKDISPEIYNIGFSPAFTKENANVTYGYDKKFASLSDDEIKEVLSGGVYLNANCVEYLNKRGLGEYVGFKVIGGFDNDCHELFLENEFNKGFAGYRRECRHSFWPQTAYGFEKTNDKAEYLGLLNDFDSNTVMINGKEAYSLGVFENSLGGRICVEGYNPDLFISCYPKTVELKRIFAWLSKNTINYIESYHNVNYIDRGVGGLVYNNSYDEAENVILALGKDIEKITLVDMNMNKKEIKRDVFENNYSKFNIGNIKPFGVVLLKY